MSNNIDSQNLVFDYRALRLMVGVIALLLPIVVIQLAGDENGLGSISAYYHTDAHDAFVGMLFIVGTFLIAYRGRDRIQFILSKLAAIFAWAVALFPTKCRGAKSCEFPGYLQGIGVDIVFAVHVTAAVALFLILAYFCFIPFQKDIGGKEGAQGRRSLIYKICGGLMSAAVMVALGSVLFKKSEIMYELGVIFWAETIALATFGVAWIVAGKTIPGLYDIKQGDEPPLIALPKSRN